MGVQHAVAAVRSFAGERDLGARAIEFRTPFNEFFDTRRTFFDQDACSLFVTETVAGLQRVFQMQADFIVIAERGGDAALRVLRVGLRNFALRQAQYATCRGKFHRGTQTRDARTHYDEIGFCRKSLHGVHGSICLARGNQLM